MAGYGNALVNARLAFFENAVEVIPPVTRKLKGLWYFQGLQAAAIRNLAPGGLSAVVFGVPTFDGDYMVSIGGSSGLQTQCPEVAEFTWIWAGTVTGNLSSSATQPGLMGTFNGSSGASMFVINHATDAFPSARVRANVYDNTNNIATQNVTDVDEPRCYACRVSPTGVKVKDLTGNLESTEVTFDAARVIPARNIRIGSTFSPSITGECKTSAAMIYEDDLTDSELDRIYAFLQTEMDRVEITI